MNKTLVSESHLLDENNPRGSTAMLEAKSTAMLDAGGEIAHEFSPKKSTSFNLKTWVPDLKYSILPTAKPSAELILAGK